MRHESSRRVSPLGVVLLPDRHRRVVAMMAMAVHDCMHRSVGVIPELVDHPRGMTQTTCVDDDDTGIGLNRQCVALTWQHDETGPDHLASEFTYENAHVPLWLHGTAIPEADRGGGVDLSQGRPQVRPADRLPRVPGIGDFLVLGLPDQIIRSSSRNYWVSVEPSDQVEIPLVQGVKGRESRASSKARYLR